MATRILIRISAIDDNKLARQFRVSLQSTCCRGPGNAIHTAARAFAKHGQTASTREVADQGDAGLSRTYNAICGVDLRTAGGGKETLAGADGTRSEEGLLAINDVLNILLCHGSSI